ncbi:hypothetical protein [Vibrio tapetis]|uniref:Uncharacterized protein n=1 Tax=Vibrio tapetis subsp. tapetis TaxID=1671868 RepID=A0A2N8ZAP7_9VIBR|nr:hypothetical protein [Vibrio tapetis]SON48966.1 protein of unknown function [Vibrio tapetis subsp. tapetis]
MSQAQDVRRQGVIEKEEFRAEKACEPLHTEIKELEAELASTLDGESKSNIEQEIAGLKDKIQAEWAWCFQLYDKD